MTYKELYDEVRHLGFEDTPAPRDMFLSAAGRALRQLYSDLPEERVATLSPVLPAVRKGLAVTVLHAGEVFRAEGEGGALSLLLGGRGSYLLTDEDGERSGFFFGTREVRLCTVGAWVLTVTAYTTTRITDGRIFEGSFSSEAEVPPPREGVTLELAREIPALLFPIGLPTVDGKELEARLTGTELWLPSLPDRPMTVRYARAPAPLTGDREDERVDVPMRAAHLLPLLVASYMFLEDDSDRAQYYMTLYRDGMLRLRTERPSYTTHYTDVLGW